MGFFSGIRRRIKKIIPKEIRPAIPFIAAAMIPGAGVAGLGPVKSKFLTSAIARGLSDDEADLKDVFRAGALAAAPAALDKGIAGLDSSKGLGKFLTTAGKGKDATSIAEKVSRFADPSGMDALKVVGTQAATDFGIKQAELNEKALEQYNADLLSRGIRDKAERRSAIFSIFTGAGYDEDEVNVMLDKYGYADGGKVMMAASMSNKELADLLAELRKKKKEKKASGGRVGFENGGKSSGTAILIDTFIKAGMEPDEAIKKAEEYFEEDIEYEAGQRKRERSSNIQSDLMTAVEGLEAAYGQPLGGRRPEPMRIIPGFAMGGDVDEEVMETEEEIITPDYLMKEEGVEIGEQVSSPNAMDELNSLSLDMFGRPVFELSEEEFEMLKDFASQQALKPGLIDEYRNYKYQMEEQGITPMSPRDYFRNEFGAARLGVAKGGKVIKIMPQGVLFKGKAKDYPGIKQLIKDMKKKGTRNKKADGGSVTFEEFLEMKQKEDKERSRDMLFKDYKEYNRRQKVKEEKTMAKDGGLMNLGGKEMDLRGGGFVPMGKKERADDVPARLSKNEFVFTADAVRAAGGGSVQKGADLMYDTMKKLEAQS